MTTTEQRASPRYAIRCEAALRDRDTDRLLPVQIYDLSAAGAAIRSHDVIVDDADYDLEFVVPGQTGTPLRAHCRVARLMLAAGGDDFCAGLVFDGDFAATPELAGLFSRLRSQPAVH